MHRVHGGEAVQTKILKTGVEMPMERAHESVLEQSRSDKIKTLGFLCYNQYVDGVMVFPEMNGIVNDIRQTLNYMLALRENNMDVKYLYMQEASLNEKLIELGCICYNLYVDSKLFNNQVLSLCDAISSINHEITNGLQASSHYEYPSSYEEPVKPVREKKSVTQSKLKVTCPYGMEPIPVGFKRCMCGYRNRPEARYCGKCGAKLS